MPSATAKPLLRVVEVPRIRYLWVAFIGALYLIPVPSLAESYQTSGLTTVAHITEESGLVQASKLAQKPQVHKRRNCMIRRDENSQFRLPTNTGFRHQTIGRQLAGRVIPEWQPRIPARNPEPLNARRDSIRLSGPFVFSKRTLLFGQQRNAG
jgi:hypothetical protein